jgi:hypothetical protein
MYRLLMHLPLLCLLLLLPRSQQQVLLLPLRPAVPEPWYHLMPTAVLLLSQDIATASAALGKHAAAAIAQSMRAAESCLLLLRTRWQLCRCMVTKSAATEEVQPHTPCNVSAQPLLLFLSCWRIL